MTVPHTTTAVHTCPGHALCDAMTREQVTLAQLTELQALRAAHHRAAASFTHLDEGVHGLRADARPPSHLVRLRDAAGLHAEEAWHRLRRFEASHPAVVRALDSLERTP